jgi:hypothetical protein
MEIAMSPISLLPQFDVIRNLRHVKLSVFVVWQRGVDFQN